jgi:hypothetical protein
MQARVNLRPLLGILSERSGLIAKKGPPRLCWPSAWCWQVTRYGGKAADQYAGNTGDEFGCAPVWQFDGSAIDSNSSAVRVRVRFGRPGLLRLSASP